MPRLISKTPFVTIDCPTALIRGQRTLRGTVQPQFGDLLQLASGMNVLVAGPYPYGITTGRLHLLRLSTPEAGPWKSILASLFGEDYLLSESFELSPAMGSRYFELQETCRDYVKCWASLTDDERRVFLHGALAAVSGVGAVVSGVAFVADLATGGIPIWQGLACAASGAFCAYNLSEMSQAAQRGARRARELQGHMQWMTAVMLANGFPSDTVIVGPTVSSYCTVVAQGFDGIQQMADRTIRSISMSTGSIPGLALTA